MRDKEYNKISINGLKINILIGHSEQERSFPQKVKFDCEILTDQWTHGSVNGDLSSTICYQEVSNLITEISLSQPWILVEELLEEISNQIFNLYPLAEKLNLRISKYVVPNTESTGVEISRIKK